MAALDISVIIPCYNEEKNIRKCLETISKQSITNYEIIMVDDGSTDRTKKIIKEFSVKLLEQNHKGPGAARNWGAREAKGDVLVFVDADMFFDHFFLENLTKPIIEKKTIGTFNKDEMVGNGDNHWAVCWNLELTGTVDRRISPDHPDDSVIFRAILKEKFLNVGGFDTSVGYEDDATLSPKLGIKALYAPNAICYHNNPGSPAEIFQSARWIGRSTRFSTKARRLFKFLPPFTLLNALAKAIIYRSGTFFFFKFVFDWGILVGGFSRLVLQKHSK